jgi:pimeloyl-ACP methyl ester carboxylesterase
MTDDILTDRRHRAVSADGTEIVGRVHGDGPPLVLVHGAAADGLSEWRELVPLLADRFTCYLPDLRGRGLSGDHPDHSREARVQDVVAFVDSIGEPVGLVGVSGGGMLALGAAARTDAVAALAALEPGLLEAIDDDTLARLRDATAALAAGIESGRTDEALGPLFELIANEEEAAALSEDAAALDELAAYLPVDLAELREAIAFEGPSPTDPAALARIDVPTLLLHGSRTASPWFTASTHFASRHIAGANMREIVGNGHLGHLVAPERVANELVPFFEQAIVTRR